MAVLLNSSSGKNMFDTRGFCDNNFPMAEKLKIRKLNYQDSAIMFMKSLLREGFKDSAWAIKSVLLEVCRLGSEYPDMTPFGKTNNMFMLHIPAVKTDDTYLQGFRIILIVMKNHILAISIEPDFA